jgi:hypothetical protein
MTRRRSLMIFLRLSLLILSLTGSATRPVPGMFVAMLVSFNLSDVVTAVQDNLFLEDDTFECR